MNQHFVPIPHIVDGVLLARYGEVHRDVGAQTKCGQKFLRGGRVSTVSHVQAIVFKLAVCRDCYPDHSHGHRPQLVLSAERRAA